MKLKHNPFPFIFSRSDDATQLACLDFFEQGNSPRAHACLSALMKQQRPDGGSASQLDPAQWGMQETVRNTLLFLEAEVPLDDPHLQNAVKFILEQQRVDGGWCENPMLKIPPEQTWLSNQRSVTWLTANVIDLLRQSGMTTRREYQTGLGWLRSIQNLDGSWPSVVPNENAHQTAPGDPDATAQITFLIGELSGEDDPGYLKGKGVFERYLDNCAHDVKRGYLIRAPDRKKEEIEVYHLTHLFLSSLLDPPRRLCSGYDIHDRRVKRMMEALIDIQCQDGGWCPFWAQESSPVYSVLALKVLLLSGMLAQANLIKDIKLYTS
ncbi:MAG: terpene cyclase/mutase family protein [Anaerolineales bacterium]|nr:terpene cyclase/mutase family protein [Anaerolineales bacterium]